MDRRQLRTLIAVSEHQSFSAAARALDTVQSNVSAHIAKLEQELEVELIDRATLQPTNEGLVVLERARRIEREFESLDSDIASLRDQVSGSVRVGVIGTTARWLVPPLLSHISEHYPLVSVIILDATTSSLTLNLHSGAIDLGVVNLPVDEADLSITTLFDEDRVLVAPRGHPLFELESVTLVEVLEHELLLEAPGTSFRAMMDSVASQHGIKLRAKAEFDGMRLLTSLAFTGFGAGIVPATAIPTGLSGEWKWIPIDGVPGRSVGLARRRRMLPSAAERVVIEGIHEVIRTTAGAYQGVYPRV